ncbi:MAG TPA: outer membrane lipoprotein-sorting protein, partial [Treponemataceae bacterium]|nr:outer membrane lipoprotein-sorting protein [Treponemataceae bacterium]
MKIIFSHRNRTIFLALVGLVLAMGLISAQSATGTESAYDIMLKVFNRPEPVDLSAELKMTLIDSRGKERARELKQISASFAGVDKKIMEFQSPADVRGTAFMNWSYTDSSRSDDQWIFLPALNRVRRISSDGKGDSFMGSDFSYDDLGARHPDKDSHKIIGTEKINGESCWIIESTPKASGE